MLRLPLILKQLKRSYYTKNKMLNFSEEVNQAICDGKPVVALESTIISHGMPYPQNLETALKVEEIIRSYNAVPATIAILKGSLTVGLTNQQLKQFASTSDVVKTSRRDYPYVIGNSMYGATTVSGTIIASVMAGIPVFVTGGLGGVHRDGEYSMDVSADLTELARNPICVVSSGVKSILDIGRTLEYLETEGVCVATYGSTCDFPAFYTRRSGYTSPYNVESPLQAAKLVDATMKLGLNSGIVIAVPVPEANAMDESLIEAAIEEALSDAKRDGIVGKEVTPYVLARVAKVTQGQSLNTNIALIKNNARIGAQIAVELNKLTKGTGNEKGSMNRDFNSNKAAGQENYPVRDRNVDGKVNVNTLSDLDVKFMKLNSDVVIEPLVIGGSNVDRTFTLISEDLKLNGSTHPVKIRTSAGGVGRNIADALWKLRSKPKLITCIGNDSDGQFIRTGLPSYVWEGEVLESQSTANYSGVFDTSGECLFGMGDMNIHNHITIDMINKKRNLIERAPIVVIDGNVPVDTMMYVIELCNSLGKPIYFEPTDLRKAYRAIKAGARFNVATPNFNELEAMAAAIRNEDFLATENIDNIEEKCLYLSQVVIERVDTIINTLGPLGVMIVTKNMSKKQTIGARLYPITPLKDVKNVSGAGDCFASGYLVAMLNKRSEIECVSNGFSAAISSLLNESTIPENFNKTYKIDNFKTLL